MYCQVSKHQTITKFLLIITLILSTNQICEQGCLKCDLPTDTCIFCDFTNNFYLQNEVCVQKIIPNCLQLSLEGKCVQCDENHYANQAGECIKITSPIENCEIYDNPFQCRYCKQDLYFNGQKCISVIFSIENCKYYNSSGDTCDVCEERAFLYIDKRYCIFLESTLGCSVWSQIQCKQCLSDFFFNVNAYVNEFLEEVKNVEDTYNFINNLMNGNRHLQVTKNCIATSIPNCKTYFDPNTCQTCIGDYLLYNNQCINPSLARQSICQETNDQDECIECSQGYFPNEGQCETVSVIYNCQEYSTITSYSKCQQCKPDFYLDRNKNDCIQRKRSLEVQNCKELTKVADQCESCEDTFVITSDGLNCLPTLADCEIYEPSSIFSIKLQCKICKEGFYYNSSTDVCVEGTAANCQVYRQFSDECKLCLEGFYLDQTKICQEHSLRTYFSCEKLSKSNPNVCEECGANQIKVRLRNFCSTLSTSIENCLDYVSDGKCEICAQGFRPNTDSTMCEEIPIPHCDEFFSDTQCAECMFKVTDRYSMKYSLDFQNLCQEPIDVDFENCNSTVTIDDEVRCHSCEKNFYPTTLPYNSRICLKRDFWILKADVKLANCVIWDFNEKCIQCEDNFFVEDGGCVSQCTSPKILHYKEIYKDISFNSMYARKKNYCVEPDDSYKIENCVRYHTSVKSKTGVYDGDLVIGCVKCAVGYLQVIDTEIFNTTTKGQAHNFISENEEEEIYQKMPFFNQCLLETIIVDALKLNGAATLLNNCKYVGRFNINDLDDEAGMRYGCFTCEDGFTGVPTLVQNKYYIESCVTMTSCSANFYKGLGWRSYNLKIDELSIFPLSIYVSCHECTDPNEIVFYGEGTGAQKGDQFTDSLLGGLGTYIPTKTKPYSLTQQETSFTQNVCLDPSTEEYSELEIPENCGIVQVLHDMPRMGYQEGESVQDSSFLCRNCKPGYRAVFDQYQRIISCTQITNCIETTFYGCKQCESGYMFGFFNDYLVVDYTSCLDQSKVLNCHAGIESSGRYYCRICEKGYKVNLDGQCDKVNVVGCEEYGIYQEYQPKSNRIQESEKFEFIMKMMPSGCQKCEADSIAVYPSELRNKKFCLENIQLAAGEKASYNYVDNCIQNFFDDNINKIRCLKCETGYLLASGKCLVINFHNNIENELENCEDIDYQQIKCAKCLSGYFNSGGLCYKGYVSNCKEFEQMYKCSECEPGFVVITLNDTNASCLQVNDNLQCASWSLEASKMGELECMECKAGKFKDYNQEVVPPFMCFDIDVVTNCKIHDKNYNIKISTYKCLECLPDYYLVDNFCVPRSIVPQCETYRVKEDKCHSCIEGYYLDEEGICLQSFSVGTTNSSCEVFFDENQCLKCTPGYYLEENTKICEKIEADSQVLNCLYYRKPSDCLQCTVNYYLEDGVCQESAARNCKEQKNINECLTCFLNYGLKEESSGIVSCVPAELEKCREFDPEVRYPFKCKICDSHHYLNDDGECVQVQTAIEFCDVYQGGNHCAVCEDKRALSEAKDGCFASNFIMEKTDSNCAQSYLVSHPKCQICSFGYYWQSDTCVKCNVLTPQNGCMMCNPQDEYNCLFCMPGYFMNKKGNCIRIAIISDGEDEEFDAKIGLVFWMVGILALF